MNSLLNAKKFEKQEIFEMGFCSLIEFLSFLKNSAKSINKQHIIANTSVSILSGVLHML